MNHLLKIILMVSDERGAPTCVFAAPPAPSLSHFTQETVVLAWGLTSLGLLGDFLTHGKPLGVQIEQLSAGESAENRHRWLLGV